MKRKTPQQKPKKPAEQRPPKHKLSIRTKLVPKFNEKTGAFSNKEKIRATVVQFTNPKTNKPVAAGYLTSNPKAEKQFNLLPQLKGKNRKWVSLHVAEDSKLSKAQIRETLYELAKEIRKKANSQKTNTLLSIPGTKFGEQLLKDRGYTQIEGTPVWKYELPRGKVPLKHLYLGTLTERTFEHYNAIFPELLKKGNKILDLGTGNSDFIKEANEKGIEAYGLDAQYRKADRGPFSKKPYPKLVKGRNVLALAQDLPFKDNSFNHAISLYGAIHYSNTEPSYKHAVAEALRVVKPEGTLTYLPLKKYDLINGLKKAGFEVKTELYKVFFLANPSQRITIKKPNNRALKNLKKIWGI